MARQPKARTMGREEETEDRLPPRMESRGDDSLDRLDPNAPIRTRSGKEAKLRFTGGEDEYDIKALGVAPPEGWEYAWKLWSCKGQEMRTEIARWEGNGWEPVPASRHDGVFMARGFAGHIERGGLVLCERDKRLGDQARMRDKMAALAPLQQADDLAGLAIARGYITEEMAEFNGIESRRFTGVKRQREAIGLKNPSGYQVDE